MGVWPPLCPLAPLPGGAGLGSLISIAMKYLGSDGVVCPKLKKLLSSEICAIMPSTKGFGSKNINLGGFSPGQEVPKPFLTAVPRLPYNPGELNLGFPEGGNQGIPYIH